MITDMNFVWIHFIIIIQSINLLQNILIQSNNLYNIKETKPNKISYRYVKF